MHVIKLMFKNSFRHLLRTALTVLGIAIAVIAFGLLRTVVTAWSIGVEASAADRLITRHSVSFILPLPYAYTEKVKSIEGVKTVCYAQWFGGVYKDKNNFFARIAIDHNTVFEVYPEFLVDKQASDAFMKEQTACIIGEGIAKQFNIKVGDIMPLQGDIFPGNWDFKVVGIYKPRDKTTDASQMLFRWDYLNERMKKDDPTRANYIGWYIVKVKDVSKTSEISANIDALFKNSSSETKTETERQFQQGFLAATSAIIDAMNVLSFVIIGIIMLVLGNTMIMSARERTREYAVMKTLGFTGQHLAVLIMGESMVISILGGAVGLFLTFPLVAGFEQAMPRGWFPVFKIETITVILSVLAVLSIGFLSGLFPVIKALRTKIVDGFRFVG